MSNLKFYSIDGIVITSKRSTSSKGSHIKVNSITSKRDYDIWCPFFCPAKRGDILTGLCIKHNDGNFEFAQVPMVEPGSDRDCVLTAMITGMGKHRFSQYMADRVYTFFEQEAKRRIDLINKHKSLAEDTGSADFTIYRSRDLMNGAVMETISWYAFNFRLDESIANPLINLGMTKDQAHKLLRWWYRDFSLRRLYLLGLTRTEIKACCERGWPGSKGILNSPDALYYQVIQNPYIPEKIPLIKAQSIAQQYGLSFDQNMIECADLIRFVDTHCEEDGWACYPIFKLMQRYTRFNQLQDTLKNQFKCTIRYNFLYLRHQAEVEDTLYELLESRPLKPTHASKLTRDTLCPEQIQAIELALNNSVSIITGGAGCGKTRCISALAHELEVRNIAYCIGSFTGQAVANLKTITGRTKNIMTLHMILARGSVSGDGDRPIQVLIIDEISMVPNELLAKVLLKLHYALNDRTGERLSVVLVGDPNQVQPIEWGDFFNQALTSWLPCTPGETRCKLAIPWIQLTEDHRRKEKGVLFDNMAQFVTAERPEDINFKWGADCEFIQGGIEQVESVILHLRSQGISHQDITIISPKNVDLEALNLRCQNIFVSAEAPMIRDTFGKVWKVGARVMMTKNRYDINVFNGDQGVITQIIAAEMSIGVKFNNGVDCKIPTFVPNIRDDGYGHAEGEDGQSDNDAPLSTKLLTLSWAITVHKSQGSQWPYILFYIPSTMQASSFFNRKLLYTGISRVSQHLYVVAPYKSAFTGAILVNPPRRFDNLSKRLIKEPYVDKYVDPNWEVAVAK